MEAVGKQLGNFFGEFLQYDEKNNTSIWGECMCIRIKIDVRKPVKPEKRLVLLLPSSQQRAVFSVIDSSSATIQSLLAKLHSS